VLKYIFIIGMLLMEAVTEAEWSSNVIIIDVDRNVGMTNEANITALEVHSKSEKVPCTILVSPACLGKLFHMTIINLPAMHLHNPASPSLLLVILLIALHQWLTWPPPVTPHQLPCSQSSYTSSQASKLRVHQLVYIEST
jgi:hypothetical protein